MNAPTSGPWTFDEHGGSFYVWGPGQAMVADGDADTDYVARMRGVGRGATVEEQRANAALIAAAPDLRDAVQATLDPIGYCDRTGQDPHEPNWLSKKLIAALTKAGRLG